MSVRLEWASISWTASFLIYPHFNSISDRTESIFGFHRLLSRRFPFAVYYELVDEIVSVVAVLDVRMHPSKIR